jgi:hypothetical protein
MRGRYPLTRFVKPGTGKDELMEAEVQVAAVEARETRSGNTRYVVRDDQGREYTTFRTEIGQAAAPLEGRRARIQFHEEQRGNFRNVYLDAIQPARGVAPAEGADTEVEEVAWKTAVESAPWLLGSSQGDQEVPPDELFEKLEPFKRLVSEDIREGTEAEDASS